MLATAEAPHHIPPEFFEPLVIGGPYTQELQAPETLGQLGTPGHRYEQPMPDAWQSPSRGYDGRLVADNVRANGNRQGWMSDEEVNARIANLEETWNQAGVPKGMGPELEKITYEGRHRREKLRLSIRIARGIGALAATSTLLYAGFEWFTRR